MKDNWIQEAVDKAASKVNDWDKMRLSLFTALDQMHSQGHPPQVCLFMLLDFYEQNNGFAMKNTLTYIFTLWLTERKISMDEKKE